MYAPAQTGSHEPGEPLAVVTGCGAAPSDKTAGLCVPPTRAGSAQRRSVASAGGRPVMANPDPLKANANMKQEYKLDTLLEKVLHRARGGSPAARRGDGRGGRLGPQRARGRGLFAEGRACRRRQRVRAVLAAAQRPALRRRHKHRRAAVAVGARGRERDMRGAHTRGGGGAPTPPAGGGGGGGRGGGPRRGGGPPAAGGWGAA